MAFRTSSVVAGMERWREGLGGCHLIQHPTGSDSGLCGERAGGLALPGLGAEAECIHYSHLGLAQLTVIWDQETDGGTQLTLSSLCF